MIDDKPEMEIKKQEQAPLQRRSPIAILLLYISGFIIVSKNNAENDTVLSITMLSFGWLCIVLAFTLSLLRLSEILKRYFKKK